jgi:undecaprenyl-diphosphatase
VSQSASGHHQDPTSVERLGAVERIDAAVERLASRLRGRRSADLTAAVVSNLADYGFVWCVIATLKAARRGPGRRRAVLQLATAGFASAALNAALKQLVSRQRPAVDAAGPGAVPVRSPRSTSFPSGHTLAAFCTAFVLADTPLERGAFLAFAAAVGASRIQLQAHHASDVVGGALIGTGLGVACRAAIAAR